MARKAEAFGGLQSATDPSVENTQSATDPQNPAKSTELYTIGAGQLVIFIVGGPGSGKGTQCSKIANEFGFVHIAGGDILREEVAKKTVLGKQVKEIMEYGGSFVPPETIVPLVKRKLLDNREAPGFILDGFPRDLPQYTIFKEQVVCKRSVVIVFECSDDVMRKRLNKRGKTSHCERMDDNPNTIETRLITHNEKTVPLIKFLKKQGRVNQTVDAERNEGEVYSDVQALIMKQLDVNASSTCTNPISEETTTST